MTGNISWIQWVSGRFLTGRRGGRGRLVFLFSVILIACGVAALNTILAVMNGLQLGYIRSVLEVGSYHMRWVPPVGVFQTAVSGSDSTGAAAAAAELIGSDPDVLAVIPLREGQTLLSGQHSQPVGSLVRGVPETLYSKDKGFAGRAVIVEGRFDVSGRGVVLGEILATRLDVLPGDTIQALDLGEAGLNFTNEILTVTGLFRSGYREYDGALALVSLNTSAEIFGFTPLELGIKLRNHERDTAVLSRLLDSPAFAGGRLSSWRETNRAFFGALRTEKLMIFFLVALVFVVVAVNIDHSLRRMATERIEDLAILKTMGASPYTIRLLFLRYGLITGGLGSLLGSVLGVLIGTHVEGILRFFKFVKALILNRGVGGSLISDFFRHSEVLVSDVIMILLLAIVLTQIAAIRASTMAACLKPSEVLRSE